MKLGALYYAIPDSGMVRLGFNPEGKVDYLIPNSVVLSSRPLRALSKEAEAYWHGQPSPLAAVRWIVNTLADADAYSKALAWLDKVAEVRVPVFNHPRAVALSRRDIGSRVLDGTHGLEVPKCIRVKVTELSDFAHSVEQSGLKYPVLVRPVSSQTGHDLTRVETEADWAVMGNYRALGDTFFLTEFINFAADDGTFAKLRVGFADGRFFIRHIKFGSNRLVHNISAEQLEGNVERELDLSKSLIANETFTRTMRGIYEQMPLDFFGVDLGLRAVGKPLVLLEANAAMSMLFDTRGGGARSEEAKFRHGVFQVPLEQAVLKALRAPQTWRFASPRAPTGKADMAAILSQHQAVAPVVT